MPIAPSAALKLSTMRIVDQHSHLHVNLILDKIL